MAVFICNVRLICKEHFHFRLFHVQVSGIATVSLKGFQKTRKNIP